MKHIMKFYNGTSDFTAWCKPKSSGIASRSRYIVLFQGIYCMVEFVDDAKEMMFLMQWSDNRVVTEDVDGVWKRLIALRDIRSEAKKADAVLFTKRSDPQQKAFEKDPLFSRSVVASEIGMMFELFADTIDEWKINLPAALLPFVESPQAEG